MKEIFKFPREWPRPIHVFLVFSAASVPGFFLGWFLSTIPTSQLPATETASEDLTQREISPAPDATSPPPIEDASAPTPDPAPVNAMERFLDEADANDMYVVPARVLGRLRTDRYGRPTTQIAEMFALSPDEVARVNRVFQKTEDRLNESELARVEIVSASDNEVILHIPASAEEARQIEEEFRNGFIDALGDIDGSLFLAIMDYSKSYDTYFNTFGAVDRKVTFSMEPRSDNMIHLEFMNESPLNQVMNHWGLNDNYRDSGSENRNPWQGFKATFHPDYPPDSTTTLRSKYLIPILPEPMQSLFKSLEENSSAHRESSSQ